MTEDEKLYCRKLGMKAYVENKYTQYGIKVSTKYGLSGVEEYRNGFWLLPGLEMFIGVCKDALKDMENDK